MKFLPFKTQAYMTTQGVGVGECESLEKTPKLALIRTHNHTQSFETIRTNCHQNKIVRIL